MNSAGGAGGAGWKARQRNDCKCLSPRPVPPPFTFISLARTREIHMLRAFAPSKPEGALRLGVSLFLGTRQPRGRVVSECLFKAEVSLHARSSWTQLLLQSPRSLLPAAFAAICLRVTQYLPLSLVVWFVCFFFPLSPEFFF